MATRPTDADALLQRLEHDEIDYLWVIYHDYSGRAAAKTVPRSGFRSAVTSGLVFALANLNMDALDHQVPDATLLADSGDFLAVPDPRSYAPLPRFPGTARVHTWMRATDGTPWPGCPRTRLQAMIDELGRDGFSVQASLEPEFYLLNRDDAGELQPVNTTTMFSRAGLAAENRFVTTVIDELGEMGVEVAQLGKEYAAGQYEMTTRHGPPLQALDDFFSLKETVRDVARERGLVTTFMPKPFASWSGNSLHVHLSLWDIQGENDLTPNPDDETTLSDVGRWFMGGLLRHVDALTGLGSPTVNSYKRLLPGSWAPANTYWGYGNRSGVIRVPGVGNRRHLEYRAGDNSCQPALFLTGLLGAGLDGLRNQIDPGPPFAGDIGHLSAEDVQRHGISELPRTLAAALAALEANEVVAAAVGPEALGHFLRVKRNELALYELEVHPWERTAYLEVV